MDKKYDILKMNNGEDVICKITKTTGSALCYI